MYSECLKVQTFSTITFCHFIKTCVWLCLCLFVCVCVRIFSMPSSVSGLVQSTSVFLFCYYTTSAVELKETRWTKTKSNPMKTLQEKNTPVGPLKPAPGLQILKNHKRSNIKKKKKKKKRLYLKNCTNLLLISFFPFIALYCDRQYIEFLSKRPK